MNIKVVKGPHLETNLKKATSYLVKAIEQKEIKKSKAN
jgi:hypothetical protein